METMPTDRHVGAYMLQREKNMESKEEEQRHPQKALTIVRHGDTTL
jgi:hypothetical protein